MRSCSGNTAQQSMQRIGAGQFLAKFEICADSLSLLPNSLKIYMLKSTSQPILIYGYFYDFANVVLANRNISLYILRDGTSHIETRIFTFLFVAFACHAETSEQYDKAPCPYRAENISSLSSYISLWQLELEGSWLSCSESSLACRRGIFPGIEEC